MEVAGRIFDRCDRDLVPDRLCVIVNDIRQLSNLSIRDNRAEKNAVCQDLIDYLGVILQLIRIDFYSDTSRKSAGYIAGAVNGRKHNGIEDLNHLELPAVFSLRLCGQNIDFAPCLDSLICPGIAIGYTCVRDITNA